MNKEEAKNYLKSRIKNVDVVLQYTHCDPPESFIIASEDMIEKAKIWGHFSNWNFERTETWLKLKNLPEEEAVKYMQENYNYTKTLAEQTYTDANNLKSEFEANSWIAQWPELTKEFPCKTNKNIILCNVEIPVTTKQTINAMFGFNLDNLNASFQTGDIAFPPSTVITITPEGKYFEQDYSSEAKAPAVLLKPIGNNEYTATIGSKEILNGLFTKLFYLNGHDLQYFKKFGVYTQPFGQKIFVWEVDWNGNQTNKLTVAKSLPQINKYRVSLGDKVEVNYLMYNSEGTIVDATFIDNQNVSKNTSFDEKPTKPKLFEISADTTKPLHPFAKSLLGMKLKDEKTVQTEVLSNLKDINASKTQNNTINIRFRVEKIE